MVILKDIQLPEVYIEQIFLVEGESDNYLPKLQPLILQPMSRFHHFEMRV